jgi:hypothetical protein
MPGTIPTPGPASAAEIAVRPETDYAPCDPGNRDRRRRGTAARTGLWRQGSAFHYMFPAIGYAGNMLAVTSQAEAGRVLQLDPHTIRKLKNCAVLTGPSDRPGIYARALETAASVLPTTVAASDVAVHLDRFGDDPDHHYGRAYTGWHQEETLALPVTQRRECWQGVWKNMGLAKALKCVGGTAAATVGGFIVDVAGVTGARICPCGCGRVVFDLQDPSPEGAAWYRGRRMLVVEQGSPWTLGPGA